MRRWIRVMSATAMAVASATVAFGDASQQASSPVTYAGPRAVLGEKVPMGNGQIWSWAIFDGTGRVQAVGVSMTETALEGLPTKGGHGCCDGPTYVLPMPAGLADVTAFKHIVINWNPQGHPPEGIYDKPHFDFHFYTIDEAQRDAIKNSEQNDPIASVAPSLEQLPADYAQAPGVVGKMGVHWIDTHAPEFNGKPFTSTFIYGSYAGAVTFMEPMITHATLTSNPKITLPVRVPAKPADLRFVPVQYRIEHDVLQKQIHVAMDNVVAR
ncbi:MAG: DUF5602 domain-containing protein [Tepidisphaeraceae bacterium]